MTSFSSFEGTAARGKTLDRLGGERLDLLVVGGGITGCGIARDAARRAQEVAEYRNVAAEHGLPPASESLNSGR